VVGVFSVVRICCVSSMMKRYSSNLAEFFIHFHGIAEASDLVISIFVNRF
jgi:hypothetical protein